MNEAQVKSESGSGAGKIFIILGMSCLVLTMIACGIGYYVMGKARTIGADLARTATVQVINQTELPEDQKQGIITHVDRVTGEFKSGKITLEEVGEILKELTEGPVLRTGVLYHVHLGYLATSTLSDSEKEAALRMVQRYCRGAIEGQIKNRKTDEILGLVQETTRVRGRTQKRFKNKLTEKEFAALRAAIEKAVVEAGVLDESYPLDIAAEVGSAVDRALGQ